MGIKQFHVVCTFIIWCLFSYWIKFSLGAFVILPVIMIIEYYLHAAGWRTSAIPTSYTLQNYSYTPQISPLTFGTLWFSTATTPIQVSMQHPSWCWVLCGTPYLYMLEVGVPSNTPFLTVYKHSSHLLHMNTYFFTILRGTSLLILCREICWGFSG